MTDEGKIIDEERERERESERETELVVTAQNFAFALCKILFLPHSDCSSSTLQHLPTVVVWP